MCDASLRSPQRAEPRPVRGVAHALGIRKAFLVGALKRSLRYQMLGVVPSRDLLNEQQWRQCAVFLDDDCEGGSLEGGKSDDRIGANLANRMFAFHEEREIASPAPCHTPSLDSRRMSKDDEFLDSSEDPTLLGLYRHAFAVKPLLRLLNSPPNSV